MNLASAALADDLGGRIYELLKPFADNSPGGVLRGWEWDYMWRRCHQELRVVKAFDGPVRSLACDPIGARSAVGGADGSVAVVETATGEILRRWSAARKDISAMAFLADNSLVTGDGAGAIKLWDPATGVELRTFDSHDEIVTSVAVSPRNRFASCSPDGTTKIWEPTNARALFVIRSEFEPNVQVQFDASGERLFTLTSGGVISIWNAENGNQIATLGVRDNQIKCFAILTHRNRLVAGCSDGKIRVWDINSRRVMKECAALGESVRQIALRSDGVMVAATGDGYSARTWNIDDNQPTATLSGRTGLIATIAYVPDSPLIVAGDVDGYVRLWTDDAAKDETEYRGDGKVLGLSFATNSDTLAAFFEDGLCRKRDLRTSEAAAGKYFFTGDGITTMDYSWSTHRVATANNVGYVMIWDWDTTKQLRCFNSRHGQVLHVAFDPTGKRLATVGLTGVANIWDAETGEYLLSLGEGKELEALRPLHSWMSSIAFSDNGGLLAVGGNLGTLEVVDLNGKRSLLTTQDHSGTTHAIAFSSEGRLLATAGDDKAIHVWDLNSGRILHSLAAHTAAVRCLTFSPDGTRLASGGSDGAIRIWQPARGELLATLPVVSKSICSITFNRDGTILATGSRDGAVKLWHATPPSQEEVEQRAARSVARYCQKSTGDTPHVNQILYLSKKLRASIEAILKNQYKSVETIGTPVEGPWRFNAKSWMIVMSRGHSKNEYDDALKWARLAHEAAPSEPWVLNTLGAALYRTGDLQAAEQPLLQAKAAIRGDGKIFPTAFLAMCRSRLGNPERALPDFETVREWATRTGSPGGSLHADLYREADLIVPREAMLCFKILGTSHSMYGMAWMSTGSQPTPIISSAARHWRLARRTNSNLIGAETHPPKACRRIISPFWRLRNPNCQKGNTPCRLFEVGG